MKDILFQLLHDVNAALQDDYDINHAPSYFNMRENTVEAAYDTALERLYDENHEAFLEFGEREEMK